MPKRYQVMPDEFRGIREVRSKIIIGTREWASVKNMDSRYGFSSPGSTFLYNFDAGTPREVWGTAYYFDKNGNVREVVITSDLKIFDERVLTAASYVGSEVPDIASISGGVIVARGAGNSAVWKDPLDDAWKTFVASTGTAPKPRTVTVHPGGPRLFMAPTTDGVDYLGYSGPAAYTKWATADGGGAENIGEDREPIVLLRYGLGDNTVVYKPNHVYIIQGSNPATWIIHLISSDLGVTAPAASGLRVGKGQFFVHESGAYFVNAVGEVTWPPLTDPIQKTWDAMIEAYSAYLKYAHATYHPRDRMIHLWIPNQASRVMNRLIKIYVPTGAISIHDDKVATSSAFRPSPAPQRVVYGSNNSKIYTIAGLTNDGAAIASEFETGIFSGDPPTPEAEKKWGYRGLVHVYLEADAAITVTVTPTIYRLKEVLVGTGQDCVLIANQVCKFPIYLPDEMGWGFSFKMNATQSLGKWRLVGYSGMYEEITDA